MSDMEDLQAKMINLKKQTKINNEKLLADVKDLQSQISNAEKQTTYKNETIKSDIEDYESQIRSLVAQVDSERNNLNAEITALESQKTYILEEIKNLEFKKNYVQNIQILQPPQKQPFSHQTQEKTECIAGRRGGSVSDGFSGFFHRVCFQTQK